MKKILGRLLSVWIFVFVAMTLPTAYAAVETYEGHGEYFMSADETLDYAKSQAKQEAERYISQQVGIKVKSISQASDSTLDYDEIAAFTESLIHITDIRYDLRPDGELIVVRATVKAEVDTEEMEQLAKARRKK